MCKDVAQGELVGHSLRTSEVGHDYERTAASKYLLEGGHCCADAGVVRDFEILVEGDVEINAYDGLFAGKIVRIDVLLHCYSVFLNFPTQI